MKSYHLRHKIVSGLVILLAVSALAVYGDAGADVLDLETFLGLVKTHGKELKLARKELDMAAVNKKEAISTALPKIFLQADYKRNLKDNFLYIEFPDFETGEMSNQKFKINYRNEYGLNAVISQTLFSFKVGAALQAAKRYKKLTEFIYQATDQAVMTAGRKVFYQTLLLEKVWQISEASEKNARENWQTMKARFKNGQVSEFQLLQAEARMQNITPETTKARRNYRIALNNLKNLAGLPVDKEIVLEGNFDTYPPLPPKIPFQKALDLRPDFNALLWEAKLRETAVKAEKGDQYPSLNLNLIYNFSSLSDYFKFERQNQSYIVALNLAVPLYTGGYRRAQVQKAKIELDKTRIKIEQAGEKIYNEIENIRLRLEEARERIESSQKTLETAKKAFQIAEISAQNGLVTQLELKDTRLIYDQATLNCYASVYDYLDAYFDWEHAVGELKKLESK